MSSPEADTADVVVSPNYLRDWALPSWSETNASKYERGRVLVVGGAVSTPGAVQLAGLAALRVGAGHLTLAVAEPVAIALAVAVPEAGVIALPADASGSVLGAGSDRLAEELSAADVVLIGPGLNDIEQTAELLVWATSRLGEQTRVVLDAYALGALPKVVDSVKVLAGRLILTPNAAEAELLSGQDDSVAKDSAGNDSEGENPADVAPAKKGGSGADGDIGLALRVARTYGAVVTGTGVVVHPDGRSWRIGAGHDGLATSGSGDVLAGAVAGILAGGASAEQAAAWATYVHASAGDRLTARIGRLGFLAREILDEIPAVMVELQH